MSLVETTREEWSPENWREQARARRERLNPVAKPTLPEPPVVAIKAKPPKAPNVIRISRSKERDFIILAVPETVEEFVPKSFNDMRGREIIKYVCALRGQTVELICGPQRLQALVVVRQEIFYLLRNVGRYSLPEIGRMIGGRDHTTALHGVRKHADRLAKGRVDPTPFDQELAAMCCRGRFQIKRAIPDL